MRSGTDIFDLIGILDIAAVNVVFALGNGILASPDNLTLLLCPEFVLNGGLESDDTSSACFSVGIENGIVDLDAFEMLFDLAEVQIV